MLQYTKEEIVSEFFPMETPRAGQMEVVERILKAFDNGTKVVLLEMPVGGGKSAIAKTIANMHESTCYATSQIILQEQLIGDFGEDGKFQKGAPMIHLKGRSNYKCVYHEINEELTPEERKKYVLQKMNCATGFCKQKGIAMCGACIDDNAPEENPLLNNKCPYWARVDQFLGAEIGLINFKAFLYQKSFSKYFWGYRPELLILDECFHPHTRIETNLGKLSIGNIVNQKIKCDVLSYNFASKQLEWKPITRWLKNGVKQTYKVLAGNRTLYPTENHKFFTPNGKKKLSELKIGDLVYINEQNISELQKQLVLGSLLGDSSIQVVESKRKSSKYINKGPRARIRFQHGPKQFEYLDFKYNILKEHTNTEPKLCKNLGFGEILKKFTTRCNFYDVCKTVIKNNIKKINLEWLNQVTEFGLAVWYMDDGSITNNSSSFHSEGFSLEENELLCHWLSTKFGIECKVLNYTKNDHELYYISLSRNGTKRLAALISKFVPYCMRYKLPSNVNLDNFNDDIFKVESHKISLQSIKLIEKYKVSTVYDIEVADNHNYFAGSTLVSNCHNIEKELLDFVGVSFNDKLLMPILSKKLPKYKTPQEYKDWFLDLEISKKLSAEAMIARSQDRLKQAEEMEELASKVDRFVLEDTDNWVVKVDDSVKQNTKIDLKPIYVKDHARKLIFNQADHIIMMSATILSPDVICNSLGLDRDKIEYISLPSTFPVENRKIQYLPVGSMSYKSKAQTLPKLLEAVYELCELHDGEKGIIHTHNFQIADAIMAAAPSHLKKRFLFQRDFSSKEEMLEKHAKGKDTIIVAPAMHEGLDLKNDLSRFQIICKIPYPNYMEDPQLKARMELSQDYYNWLVCLKICQSYGRSIRSETDWAVTYILDSDFRKLISAAHHMLPKWFTEAIVN